jgi:hypothetical protein
VLPKLKRKVGRKMLIGDNLSSHISPAVIDACQKNDIPFVCLPPTATDKLQPLDVAVFASLKAAWRVILMGYKCQHPDSVSLKKSDFSGLLKDLLIKAAPGQHLPARFKKCGLFPVCPQNAMDWIPSRNMETDSASVRQLMDSSLGDKHDQLLGAGAASKNSVRGKKIKVPPGKSYCTVDNGSNTEEEDNDKEEEEDSSDEVMSEDEERGDLQRIQTSLLLDPVGSAGSGTRTLPWRRLTQKVNIGTAPYQYLSTSTILIPCQM